MSLSIDTLLLVFAGSQMDGCTTIGPRAFADCRNLVYVYIPASVTSIAEDAFEGCGEILVITEDESKARSYAESHGMSCVRRQPGGE